MSAVNEGGSVTTTLLDTAGDLIDRAKLGELAFGIRAGIRRRGVDCRRNGSDGR
jgi:hypothetical protein